MIENITEALDLIHKNRLLFGNIDSWLIWNLTGGTQNGVHITDVSNASRTLLMNLETLTWDDDILDFFDIPKSILPVIRPSIDSGIYMDIHKLTILIQLKFPYVVLLEINKLQLWVKLASTKVTQKIHMVLAVS